MINFLRTRHGNYVAVETIAKLTHVIEPPFDRSELDDVEKLVSFRVETKRGQEYEMAPIPRSRFYELLGGE